MRATEMHTQRAAVIEENPELERSFNMLKLEYARGQLQGVAP